MMRKRQFPWALVAVMTLCGTLMLTSCSDNDDTPITPPAGERTIVVLFENDVHCAIGGYASLAGLRDAVSDTAYAALVSSGDYLQGGTIGAISKGQYIIDVMRSMHYDAVTVGNHEFDYQTSRLQELMASFNAPVVCCNLYDMNNNRLFPPYTICTYGSKRIAYVGVLTPETQLQSEIYAFYDEKGKQLYDTRCDSYTQLVQQAADDARKEGADYVILLSHMGENVSGNQYTTNDLIAATRGIDVVLDGHTHSVVNTTVTNSLGQPVILCQTGTQFANVGKLVITKDGSMSATLIPTEQIANKNAEVAAAVDKVNAIVDEKTDMVVFHSDVPLLITDGHGNRMVRKAETNAGDLATDALRYGLNAQIGLINGGAIRIDIPAGDVKYREVYDMMPFEDYVWKIDALGSQILAVLEKGIQGLPGETGGFVQASGLKYTARAADKKITDVQVLQPDGTYAPLDPEAHYSVAVLDFCVTGGGFGGVFRGNTTLETGSKLSRDLVVDYVIVALHGNVGTDYASPQGRITIVE